MSWRRIGLTTVTVIWLPWFGLATYANLSESGSFFGPGPAEAYDLPDLEFWAALMAAIYLTPVVLALCWWATLRNSKKNA